MSGVRWTPEQLAQHQSKLPRPSLAQLAASCQPKKPKYGNTKTEFAGITFDSKAEAQRYAELRQQEKFGLIQNLQLQVPFDLAPSVVLSGRTRPALRYIADFVYEQDGSRVVEDVKGVQTKEYRIKRHLMMSVHGIEIKEHRKGGRRG